MDSSELQALASINQRGEMRPAAAELQQSRVTQMKATN